MALLDQLLGAANIAYGVGAMTAELTIRYRKPTPIGVPLHLAARTDEIDGRKVFASGEITADGVVTAEATGVFIRPTPERLDCHREIVCTHHRPKGAAPPTNSRAIRCWPVTRRLSRQQRMARDPNPLRYWGHDGEPHRPRPRSLTSKVRSFSWPRCWRWPFRCRFVVGRSCVVAVALNQAATARNYAELKHLHYGSR